MTREKFTLFYGGTFSQWWRSPSQFVIDSISYNCAEQYMMAEKARLFGDTDIEHRIMTIADHPRDQKALGKLVSNFEKEKWDAVARDIVYKGNYAKFTQNEAFKEVMLKTVGTTLVEASPFDAIWGIKMGQDNPNCHDRSKWKGTNWLGEVLTKVREDIIAGVETTKDFNWS